MLVSALLVLAASSTVSEVELTPTQLPPPLVVAPAPTREEVSRADAARVERWLEALAGFERDQRRTAGIVALGGGAGLVLAGGLVLADSTLDDRTTRGPALLGAGGALLATGVVIYLITGKAEDLAAELAAADLEDPVRRAQAIRTTEAQVVELAQEYRSTRTLNGVVLLAAGAASLVLTGVLAADTTRGDDAYLPPIVGGTGVAAVGLGVYMLTVGRMPVERVIEGYTPVTLSPSLLRVGDDGVSAGVSGSF